MAGRPKTKAVTATLEKVGIDAICQEIADGKTLQVIADALAISRPMLSGFLARPENADRYAHARETRAGRHAERIEQLADKVEAGEIDPNVARVSIDARKWVAARMDPVRWGDAKGTQVNISFNDLHIGSLKRVNTPEDNQVIDILTDNE